MQRGIGLIGLIGLIRLMGQMGRRRIHVQGPREAMEVLAREDGLISAGTAGRVVDEPSTEVGEPGD